MIANPDRSDDAAPTMLTLADFAHRFGRSAAQVRRMLRDRDLVGVRVEAEMLIPERFMADGEIVRGLAGTITLLTDAGYRDEEIVAWLFDGPDGATAIDRLHAGQVTGVHRQAQIAGF